MPKLVSFNEGQNTGIADIDENDFGMAAFGIGQRGKDQVRIGGPFGVVKGVSVRGGDCLDQFAETVGDENAFVGRIIFICELATGFAAKI